MLECNLKWKTHFNYLKKKVNLIAKIRYSVFVDLGTLTNLYYSPIHPFLTYPIIAWRHTYESIIKTIFYFRNELCALLLFLQHTNPLFKSLNLVKLYDLFKISTATFVFKFHDYILPTNFNSFFTPVNQVHHYNTRLSSIFSYSLSKPKTNYGLLNIRYQGPVIWNSLDISFKSSSLSCSSAK